MADVNSPVSKIPKWYKSALHSFVFISLVSIIWWTFGYKQNGWGNNDGSKEAMQIQFFSWHPLLNVLAFIVLTSEAVIAFQIWDMDRYRKKMLHAALNTVSFGLSIAAFVIVVMYHNHNDYPNFYSVHSWIGLMVYILLWSQFLFAIFVYLIPGLVSERYKARMLPVHRMFGLVIYGGSVVASISGLMEKQGFVNEPNLTTYKVFTNIIGLFLLITASLVLSLPSILRDKRVQEEPLASY